jgi:hypothetical protein
MPRSNGRVAVSMIDGKPVYIRDGRVYEHGMLGGGLIEAVYGNPAATAAANEYHDHIRDGLIEVLGGTGAMVGGMTWFAVEAATSPDPNHPKVDALPLIISAIGMGIMLYGAGDLATAEPYRWDAINLFNDGAELAEPVRSVPGYRLSAPGSPTPSTSP